MSTFATDTFRFFHANSSIDREDGDQTSPFLLHHHQQQRQYYEDSLQQSVHRHHHHHLLQQHNSYHHENDPPQQDDYIISQVEKDLEGDVGGGGDEYAAADDMDMIQSSSASPINYFFNRDVFNFSPFTTPSPEESLLVGGVGGDTDRFFSNEQIIGSEENYNYILLNGGSGGRTSHPIMSGFDSSYSFTTSFPVENVGGNYSVLDDNLWAVFDEQYLRHSLGWTITLVIAYMLILVIGIIGNCMVILVVIFRPQMRTVTNMFIMNLAVADLFVIVFCVPATLLANVFTPWVLGSFMCKGVAYVQGVSVCASAYSLAAISLDRCKAIYRPMERPRGLSKSQALFTICLIWVVALLMTIPWAVIFNVVLNKNDGLSYCIETWENAQHGKIYFLFANLFACYCLPLILISISNIIIWCHVAHRKVPQDSASASTIKKLHRRTRHGVRKMLGIVTLAFLLSWLPLYVLVTRVKFSESISEDESNVLDILMPLAQWLGSWNSSINPVLYAFLNSKFREMFKSLLPTWLLSKNQQRIIMRNNVGRGTITNGTFTVGGGGTTGGGGGTQQSYATVFNGRNSTGRSSNNNSRRFSHHHSHKSEHNNRRSLLVSSFRGGDLPASSFGVVGGTTTTPIPSPTNIVVAVQTTTVSALVGSSSSGGGYVGGGGGNGTSTIMTTTAVTTNTTATITDL